MTIEDRLAAIEAALSGGLLLVQTVGKGDVECHSTLNCKDPPYNKYRLFRVPVYNIRQGDELIVHGDFQVTGEPSDLGSETIMVSSQLLLSATSGDLAGVEIAQNSGQNFRTTDEHHFRTTRFASWTADADYTERWLLFVVWAALGGGKTGSIKVDVGKGQLIGHLFRKALP